MALSQSLTLDPTHINSLKAYLPTSTNRKKSSNDKVNLPHLTLTYAASLDSIISHAPGAATVISGSETKCMTHFLRAHHDAILVGATTAIIDNPRLICRWVEDCSTTINNKKKSLERQPRPIVIDPSGRWLASLKGDENLLRLAHEGHGHSPWVITCTTTSIPSKASSHLNSVDGECLKILSDYQGKDFGIDWQIILSVLMQRGIRSLMVEGGATVIQDLLRGKNRPLLSSIIVTIAPLYLGKGGVVVSPEKEGVVDNEICRLKNVKWIQMEQDVVMAAWI